ncbi:MAG: ORF6N domain-containing protein [Thermodesulfobacteriota bacterium]
MNELVPAEAVASKIYLIRGQKVILDADLADLYGVQVRRNNDRFPEDFMFVLTRAEYNLLRSQSGTLERGQHAKYLPMAFIEQGVAMLSGVLTSKRANQVNIAIMRAFVRMRELLATNKELAQRLAELEKRLTEHDENFGLVFEALRQLLADEEKPKKKIGF